MHRKDLITDPNFKSGFMLQGVSPVTDQRKVYNFLNYGGKAIESKDFVWLMSQWWSPFDFKNAKFTEDNGIYHYENESRYCNIDVENGSFEFSLNSDLEYKKFYGHARDSVSLPWSHFLLEQDLLEPIRLKKMVALFARIKFSIEKVKKCEEEHFDSSIHTAQFLWYVTIQEKETDKKSPLGGKYIWFGIPFYDDRYSSVKKYVMIDQGFDGATNSMIYSMDSTKYLGDTPLVIGKEYEIDIDIYPYIKEAVRTAIRKKIFKNSSSLILNYMNIGWELPGSYEIQSKMKDLHLEAVYND